MNQPQYIQVLFDEHFRKIGITMLVPPSEPFKNMRLFPVGKEQLPMLIEKTDEGYQVTVDTADRCIGRILNAINNHVKEWINDL